MVFADADWPLWVGIFLLLLVVGAALFGLFVFGALGAIVARAITGRRGAR